MDTVLLSSESTRIATTCFTYFASLYKRDEASDCIRMHPGVEHFYSGLNIIHDFERHDAICVFIRRPYTDEKRQKFYDGPY